MTEFAQLLAWLEWAYFFCWATWPMYMVIGHIVAFGCLAWMAPKPRGRYVDAYGVSDLYGKKIKRTVRKLG